jgi:uncharacterized protein
MYQAPADHTRALSAALRIAERGVRAALKLLEDKATVPFIARYRKEATGGLDEVQLREIEALHKSLQDLWERKETVLEAIDKQGALSAELRRQIESCTNKAELEDLYLPFKPRRRTRAQAARERGLEPLADRIEAQPLDGSPKKDARAFVDPKKEVPDVEAALLGASDIVAERVAEQASVRALCRETYAQRGVVKSSVVKKVAAKGPTQFEQYYDFSEAVSKVPSHRYLAMRRGENEGVLRVKVTLQQPEALVERICRLVRLERRSPYASILRSAVEDSFKRLLSSAMDNESSAGLKAQADAGAIKVFAENLRHLLLAAPLGQKAVLGIDPGFRTGCKCAAIDATGKLQEHATIYPTGSAEQKTRAQATLLKLVRQYCPAAIAVGNGTAGRETVAFVRDALKSLDGKAPDVVSVNEAGASVYSASETARKEFPDLDLTIRGAISIARRLQDPLAELVKIEPRAIGVGQYQHDVSEAQLSSELAKVVESCVNHVGVELNTASAALLSHVAGLGPALAQAIVGTRESKGPFRTRKELLSVPKLGPKTFQQAAGFLRIREGRHPLDASAVHPERYAVVEGMARQLGVSVRELLGNSALVDRVDLQQYVDEAAGVGLPTLRDIVSELKKPGRDPRASFEAPKFRDDVNTLEDLREGMRLEGVVTNVTAFGAFVDLGVHQDGLVHVSQLADRFVKDPAEVVKVGDRLSVRVLAVDTARKRISLSARSEGSVSRR